MRNDTCKNCGGDKGIHHWQTNQCPFGGREAPLGQKEQYTTSVYEPVESTVEFLLGALKEIATSHNHLDDESMEETYGTIAVSQRRLARFALMDYERMLKS